ncbi:hypothetical protein LTR08_000041 [Meristemomyces frigidus]|nr:hypothetical protein LTR08_000041 [Meristemomyces frigidus]
MGSPVAHCRPTSPVSLSITVPLDAPHNPLTTLIRRLEAATSRLEDIAASTSPQQASPHHNGVLGVPSTAALPQASSAPDLPTTAQKSVAPVAPPAPVAPVAPVAPLPEAAVAMDGILATQLKDFVEATQGIDALSAEQAALLEQQASLVARALAEHRRFLLVTSQAKKPQDSVRDDILHAQNSILKAVADAEDSHRSNALKEHLLMIAGGMGALQWPSWPGTPAEAVASALDTTQYHRDKVLMKYKATSDTPSPAHVKYVRAYYALVKAFQELITKHYPKSLTWNNTGIDAAQAYRESSSSPSPPTANGAPSASGPPPPPPPPLPQFDNIPGASSNGSESGGMSSVFSALNRENIASGLKKVDKSQMTHKNPSLRTTAVVPGEQQQRSKSPGAPGVKPKPESMRRQNSLTPTPSNPSSASAKKAPQKELDGNKWLISNWTSPSQPIEIEITSFTQSVLITACTNTTIILKGKANAISIDNSPRLQLLVETLVSSVDVIKSPNFAIQVTGSVPTILMDQVDGATVYLGGQSLDTEVFTSKCSGINVVLPPPEGQGEEEDSKEVPIPEQIRTFVKGGRLVSEIVEHAG